MQDLEKKEKEGREAKDQHEFEDLVNKEHAHILDFSRRKAAQTLLPNCYLISVASAFYMTLAAYDFISMSSNIFYNLFIRYCMNFALCLVVVKTWYGMFAFFVGDIKKELFGGL